MIDLEDIMPIRELEFHEARNVDPNDPSIFGNEFEVPQEQTLNTEDFAFTGLPPNADKPRLYIGPTDDPNDPDFDQSIVFEDK